MGEKMTLDDALSKAQPYTVMHGKSGQYPDGTGWGHAWNEDGVWLPREAWAVIRAHLTQPAQAVDVERIVAAMGHLPDNRAATRHELIRAFTLTAALAKDSNGAEGAAGWRPIATAPKDGKEVLVAFTADGVRQVAEASWSDDEDVWVCSRDGFMLYRRNEPTHWMPLPDAPQEDTPDAAR